MHARIRQSEQYHLVDVDDRNSLGLDIPDWLERCGARERHLVTFAESRLDLRCWSLLWCWNSSWCLPWPPVLRLLNRAARLSNIWPIQNICVLRACNHPRVISKILLLPNYKSKCTNRIQTRQRIRPKFPAGKRCPRMDIAKNGHLWNKLRCPQVDLAAVQAWTSPRSTGGHHAQRPQCGPKKKKGMLLERKKKTPVDLEVFEPKFLAWKSSA